MNPWEIAGHDWAVEMLQQHILRGEVRHAYLLTGPSGVGRRTLAIRLAQALNCQSAPAPGVPCRVCRSCRQIEAGQNVDLMVVQAEAEGKTLKVDQVRDVKKFLSLKPFLSPFKIVLFLRFQEANANAQNALLKMLEEAPSYALLLLTADNAEQLQETIVSRCEILRLRPLSVRGVEEFLALKGVGPEKAHLLGHLSGGRAGYALRLSTNEQALAFRAEKLADARALLAAKRRERFAYAEKLFKGKDRDREKENFRQALLLWLSFWRDVLLCAAKSGAPLTNIDMAEDLEALGYAVPLHQARLITESLEKALERLDYNVNMRLLAEVTLMDWPKISL